MHVTPRLPFIAGGLLLAGAFVWTPQSRLSDERASTPPNRTPKGSPTLRSSVHSDSSRNARSPAPIASIGAAFAGLRDETQISAVLTHWVEHSPADALAWLQARPDRARWSYFRDLAMNTWARTAPDAALTWTLSRPPGEREDLMAQLAIGMTHADPQLAADFAGEFLPDGPGRALALAGIAAGWAQRDPAAAATWAAGLNDTATKREALAQVLYSWFDTAPTDVAAWVGRVSESAERDVLQAQLVRWQAEKDPVVASAFLNGIVDETLRAEAALGLVRDWARDDLDVAGAWTLRLPPSPLRTQLVAELAAIAGERADPFR
jgi:hypothetical protein